MSSHRLLLLPLWQFYHALQPLQVNNELFRVAVTGNELCQLSFFASTDYYWMQYAFGRLLSGALSRRGSVGAVLVHDHIIGGGFNELIGRHDATALSSGDDSHKSGLSAS